MRIKHYLSLVRFPHTIFALPFAAAGFFWGYKDVSPDVFPWSILAFVLLCMVFARNAAMGFNRYVDREFDAGNRRTSEREIPSGTISPKSALIFVVINCALFCFTAFFINRLTLYLSPIALSIILGYSYTKRFTRLCHFVLGLSLSIAPTAAYISVTGHFSVVSILISCAVLFWAGGFDILYALLDESFDKENGLYSIPRYSGRRNAMILSSIAHVISASIITYTGIIFERGFIYFTGVGVFIVLLIYQHLIIKPDNLKRLNEAFFTVNGIASVCYASFTVADLFVKQIE